MKLITKEIEKKAPGLYETEEQTTKKIIARFFLPGTSWTWYMVEYDPVERRAYGLVDGDVKEWGYFMISDLEKGGGPLGLPAERDMYFGNKQIDIGTNEITEVPQ